MTRDSRPSPLPRFLDSFFSTLTVSACISVSSASLLRSIRKSTITQGEGKEDEELSVSRCCPASNKPRFPKAKPELAESAARAEDLMDMLIGRPLDFGRTSLELFEDFEAFKSLSCWLHNRFCFWSTSSIRRALSSTATDVLTIKTICRTRREISSSTCSELAPALAVCSRIASSTNFWNRILKALEESPGMSPPAVEDAGELPVRGREPFALVGLPLVLGLAAASNSLPLAVVEVKEEEKERGCERRREDKTSESLSSCGRISQLLEETSS
mmetsp:Transcript_27292/g.89110  ORF Transcript_27292/g.89110 Transcript_27292/m.89110 type:complete len:272 (+) Transcript_27292:160-975(+)